MNSISYALEQIVRKQREEFLLYSSKQYYSRKKESDLREALSSSLVKVVLGPRRAGKSRLIQKVLENKKVAYLNFEEELFQASSGDAVIEAARKVYPDAEFWYLDEIQDMEDWETLVNKLHRRGFNLVITGSNAKLLSSELATALTGRHIPIELLPFSYKEYLGAKGFDKSWNTFQDYLEKGGYPEILFESSISHKQYLKTLYDSVILKDLVKRKKIRNPGYLTNTLSIVTNNIGSRISSRALSKALKSTPSPTTIEKYLTYLEEAYLVETLQAYSHKTKTRINSERKPYLIDTGILSALNSGSLPIMGKQLENAVYLHLRRLQNYNDIQLFYYREEQGREIDFLIKTAHEITDLIQVSLNLSTMETREREVRVLKSAHKEYPKTSLTIVTANEPGSIKLDSKLKIDLVPVWEYCSME
ncbi:MAG TPA: ATP-binding protein [Oligoflexia bacterium]|nr:ATP-binding protein [Oligoflexia bacterium]HMP49548.1 ATP-binding protein [Oligoflexia bacterium]